MIKIGKQYIQDFNGKTRLYCDIDIDSENRKIWFEVEKKYEEYLVCDRADAYLIGILNYAMRNNHNIECDMPVTDELLYNIKEVLIPSLVKHDNKLYNIEIKAETIEPYKAGEHIGTGLSCGVDSFYSILKHNTEAYKSMKLTDVCINSVGSFNESYKIKSVDNVKKQRYEMTTAVANELGINLIKTDSNFWEEINQVHLLSHTYSSTFAIYMLQKYWKKYYYASSGYDFENFELDNNSQNDCAEYELLSLQCFSTSSIRIYSDGGELTRIEKVNYISKYSIAQKYLHVCILDSKNCGECSKCIRTLLSLEALNELENFREVFDIEKYKTNRRKYYNWLWQRHYVKDEMNEPTYQILKKRKEYKVSCLYKIKTIIKELIKKVLRKNK